MTFVIFEGDWGGQIYLTVPKTLVGPKAQVDALLAELDRAAWGCNEGDGARAYDHDSDLDGIGGGMGGGELRDGLWIHDEFQTPEWEARIRELLDLQSTGTHPVGS